MVLGEQLPIPTFECLKITVYANGYLGYMYSNRLSN